MMKNSKVSTHPAPFCRVAIGLIMAGLSAGGPLPLDLHAQTSQVDRATASQSATAIDQAWQKASAKYDGQRDTILKTVKTVATAGPFQPDWQSLSTYEVPEWYKDAKEALRRRLISAIG